VSPVKYKLGFYITEDYILHSDRPENLKPHITSECPNAATASESPLSSMRGVILGSYDKSSQV
jgi:hypothetical protein